jgi:hypoxanthine phosphoribosyltransferase
MAEPAPGRTVPGRLLVAAEEVDAAFSRLAGALQPLVDAAPCTLLGVLMGGLLPLARITGLLRGDFLLDGCRISRYGDATEGGTLEMPWAPRLPMAGRTVIIIDDIFDQGLTLEYAAAHCRAAGAAQVLTAVLVSKRHARQLTAFRPDHVGLEIGDEFVFGAGLDHRQHWRHLAEIRALDAAVPAR